LPAVLRPVTLAAALALLAAGCGADKKASEATATPARTATPKGIACANVADPGPKHEPHLSKPHTKLDPAKTYVATVKTSCGAFQITLDAKRAPVTGGSFSYLVSKRFYDDLTFHRIVPGFVIQGGDPKGDGTGGPGYSVVEAPPRSLRYTRGVVAMAKTQFERPGTSGSQFFVVTADDAKLPPEYALLGRVTGGQAVVARIAAADTDRQQRPLQAIVIDSVTITVR
jgi:peptidyl-prolyl cis-trans isomerase B (cyclophilin B)